MFRPSNLIRASKIVQNASITQQPIRSFSQLFKENLEQYDVNGKLVKPYPTVSKDKDMFEVQQNIFGYHNSYDQMTFGRKKVMRYRGLKKPEYHIPVRQREVQLAAAAAARKVIKKNEDPVEVGQAQVVLNITRTTPERLQRLEKLAKMRKRGKGPPKKGMGKRAARKK